MRVVAASDRVLARVAAIGLALLLLLLPFHLLIKRLVPGPIGTYWKDALVIAAAGLIAVWAIRRLTDRSLPRPRLRSIDPLTLTVAAFAIFLPIRAVFSDSLMRAAWGLYLGWGFLPIYFLIVTALTAADPDADGAADSPIRTALRRIAIGLVLVGVIVALGGGLEFLTDRGFVPSAEIYERGGYYAVYVFGTDIRRAYFTFDAPTALGHFLTLILPLAVAVAGVTLTRPGGQRRLPPWGWVVWAVGLVVLAFGLTVTFSRAAWVGAVAGLAWFGLAAAIVRNRWVLGAGLVGLAALALGWAAGSTVAGWRENRPRLGVEVPAEQYARLHQIAAGRIVADLMPGQTDAAVGPPPATAVWTIGQDARPVAVADPAGPAEIRYRWDALPGRSLLVGVAVNPDFWGPDFGDGVRLSGIVEADGASTPVFTRHLNPKTNPADRKWRNFQIDLGAYQGRPVEIRLRVDPEQDARFDQVGWAEPRLATGLVFDLARTTAVASEQVESIGNWSEDSNQDRVAAWRRSIALWRESPIWGHGVGATGAATFRTAGGAGFVTESQFLKVLVELGLIGFAAYLAIFAAAAWTVWQTLRRPVPPAVRWLAIGLTGALGAAVVDGLVLQNLEIKQVQAVFWFLLATLALIARPAIRAKIPAPAPDLVDVRS